MLTLTRSVGERIYIGDDIVVEVRAILDGRQVRISIDAPRQVPIHRAEIYDAISRQNRSAVISADAPAKLSELLGAASSVPGPVTTAPETPGGGPAVAPAPPGGPAVASAVPGGAAAAPAAPGSAAAAPALGVPAAGSAPEPTPATPPE